MIKIPISTLRERLIYDPVTGHFTWKCSGLTKRNFWGKRAGGLQNGYRVIKLEGKNVLAHRIAFAMQNGEWPEGPIDHIDGDPDNNSWENLRQVTLSENQHNRKSSKNICWSKSAQKWVVYFKVNGQNRHIGSFSSKTEALKARNKAKRELHPSVPRKD
jgi:hypothetical protein